MGVGWSVGKVCGLYFGGTVGIICEQVCRYVCQEVY